MWRWKELQRLKWVHLSWDRSCTGNLFSPTDFIHFWYWKIFVAKFSSFLSPGPSSCLFKCHSVYRFIILNNLIFSFPRPKCSSKSPHGLFGCVDFAGQCALTVYSVYTLSSQQKYTIHNMHNFSRCSWLFTNINGATWLQERRQSEISVDFSSELTLLISFTCTWVQYKSFPP